MNEIVLTVGSSNEFWRDESLEIRFLSIPEDPELLGGAERERRRSGRRDGLVDVLRLRRGHAAPHAQDVAGEAARVAADHRVRQRSAAFRLAAALAPDKLTPFYAIQLRLEVQNPSLPLYPVGASSFYVEHQKTFVRSYRKLCQTIYGTYRSKLFDD